MSLTAALILRPIGRAAGGICAATALATLAEVWRDWKNELSGPYRPELHYMRGPGPKWREKHAP